MGASIGYVQQDSRVLNGIKNDFGSQICILDMVRYLTSTSSEARFLLRRRTNKSLHLKKVH